MAEGIRYAVANGARIINLSLETPTDDKRVRAAIKAAQAADVLIVCSAGNTAPTSTGARCSRSRSRRRTWSASAPRRPPKGWR